MAGSSRISTIEAPRKVSLISWGDSLANESGDVLYNAAVIRSAEFNPFSDKTIPVKISTKMLLCFSITKELTTVNKQNHFLS